MYMVSTYQSSFPYISNAYSCNYNPFNKSVYIFLSMEIAVVLKTRVHYFIVHVSSNRLHENDIFKPHGDN